AEKFRRRKESKPVVRVPTKEEFSALVFELNSSPKAIASGAAAMVEFLAYSGMRVGEAREVRFRDINLEPLPVCRVLITGGISGTKNHEERVIPLFPKLREVIQRIIDNAGDISPDSKLSNTLSPRDAMENAFQDRKSTRLNSSHEWK